MQKRSVYLHESTLSAESFALFFVVFFALFFALFFVALECIISLIKTIDFKSIVERITDLF